MLCLLPGCRHAHAESTVGSVVVRWLRHADLGTEEIAYHTAQNLYSLHTPTVRVTLQLRGYPVSENTRGRMRFIFQFKSRGARP